MTETITVDAYRELLTKGIPLIDTRAPIEFARGSFPAAINLPLLNDQERQKIGTRYRQAGQQAAIELGEQLVSGSVKEQRLQSWIDFLEQCPEAVLLCFRGGLRSRTAQQWLADAGFEVPRIAGGYKALRNYLLNAIAETSRQCSFLLVAGKTGCAKTRLINSLSPAIDLEGLACHRGSAFGRRLRPQPSQIDFENRLAIDLLQLPFEDFDRIILEDESRAIGSLSVPVELFKRMQQAPVAVIEEPLSYRVDTVLHEYVEVNFGDYLRNDPATAGSQFSDYLFSSLKKIRRRLGDDLYREIRLLMEDALQQHLEEHRVTAHGAWIEKLLHHYYDPMYDYQLEKKLSRLVFRGDSEEFRDWSAGLHYRRN